MPKKGSKEEKKVETKKNVSFDSPINKGSVKDESKKEKNKKEDDKTVKGKKVITTKKGNESNERKHRKQYKHKPGTAALMDIRRLQKSTDLLMSKAPIIKLIKEISQSQNKDMRWRAEALELLQHYAENKAVEFFQDTNRAAIHGGRVTVMKQDIRFVASSREWAHTLENAYRPTHLYIPVNMLKEDEPTHINSNEKSKEEFITNNEHKLGIDKSIEKSKSEPKGASKRKGKPKKLEG